MGRLAEEGIKQFAVSAFGEATKPELLGAICLGLRIPHAVVFCNTESACKFLATRLRRENLSALVLPDMPPDERADAIDQFVSYDVNILVTTGAWPQDLPVESAEVVYMYDFPESGDSYVKQIGKCDKPGVREALVITFVRDFQDSWRERLEAECCTRIEPLPEHITGLYRRCFPIVVTPAAWNSIQKLAKKHGLL